jgi:signal peptidase I
MPLDFIFLRPYNKYTFAVHRHYVSHAHMRKFLSSLLEVLEVAVIAVVAVFIVRTYLVQPFLVSGSSMSPTFENGDYVLVDELTYHLRAPERGEVVVFHDPQDYATYFIKRVIGLPGEKVVIKNNSITVYNTAHPNGFALDESYLPAGTPVGPGDCTGGTLSDGACTYNLDPNTYLTLGDNREFSYDSRDWGPLPAKNIVGLVRVRLWPLNAITAFAAPQY